MKKVFFKISNTLLMWNNNITRIGLVNGKMGICLFLYHSARETGFNYYSDLAGELLDEIMENINSHINLSFANGLIGIRYGINYLIEEKFIDANPSHLFNDVDNIINSNSDKIYDRDFKEDVPLFSFGLYLLDFIKYQEVNSETRKYIIQALDQCKSIFDKDFDFNKRSILYLNSIIYFLIKLRDHGMFIKSAETIIDHILRQSIGYLDNNAIQRNDFHITEQLITLLRPYTPLAENFLDKLYENQDGKKKELNIFDIDRMWQSWLYLSPNRYILDKNEIDKLVNDRLETILDYESDPLCQELFMLGLSIANDQKK